MIMVSDKVINKIIELIIENIDIEIDTLCCGDLPDAYPYLNEEDREKVKNLIKEMIDDS